jgi:hypothetical protein
MQQKLYLFNFNDILACQDPEDGTLSDSMLKCLTEISKTHKVMAYLQQNTDPKAVVAMDTALDALLGSDRDILLAGDLVSHADIETLFKTALLKYNFSRLPANAIKESQADRVVVVDSEPKNIAAAKRKGFANRLFDLNDVDQFTQDIQRELNLEQADGSFQDMQTEDFRNVWQRYRVIISLTVPAGTTALGLAAGAFASYNGHLTLGFGLWADIALGGGIGLASTGVPLAIANIVASCKQDPTIVYNTLSNFSTLVVDGYESVSRAGSRLARSVMSQPEADPDEEMGDPLVKDASKKSNYGTSGSKHLGSDSPISSKNNSSRATNLDDEQQVQSDQVANGI